MSSKAFSLTHILKMSSQTQIYDQQQKKIKHGTENLAVNSTRQV